MKHAELTIYSRQAAKSLPKNGRCTVQSQCEPSTRLAPQSSSAFQHKYGNALPQRHIEYEHRMGSAGTRIPPHPPMWSQKNDACSSVQYLQSTISFSHNEAKTSESDLDYTILPASTLLLVHFPVHRQDSGRCTPVACTTRALMANVLILHDQK